MSQNVTAPPVQAEAPPATPELLSRCLGSMSLTLKRSDCSFHAAGDPRDWEQSIALMEQAQARGSWEESCSFLRVPFGPLLHTLSFANGRELSNFEVACRAVTAWCLQASFSLSAALQTGRGGAAGAAFREWVAAAPRVPRGSSADASRARRGSSADGGRGRDAHHRGVLLNISA